MKIITPKKPSRAQECPCSCAQGLCAWISAEMGKVGSFEQQRHDKLAICAGR